jgi:hypothetical protein
MRTKTPWFAAGALLLLLTAVILLWPGSTRASAGPTDIERSWSFSLDRVHRVPGESESRMFGFVFEVDSFGRPALMNAFDCPGTAPESREDPEIGRTYRWRLADAGKRVLSEGTHFDNIALYTPGENEACEKTVAGAHGMAIRVPFVAGAKTLTIELIGTRTDKEEHR